MPLKIDLTTDEYSVTPTEIKNVGPYTATVTTTKFEELHPNYQVSSGDTSVFTVTKLPVTISWKWDGVDDSASKWPYDGKAHAPSVSADFLESEKETLDAVLNDLISITNEEGEAVDKTSVKDVDYYTATITKEVFEANADLGNYGLAQTSSADLTIERRPVDVIWSWADTEGKSSIVYDGKAHTPSASFEGVDDDHKPGKVPADLIDITRNGSDTDSVVDVGNYKAEIEKDEFEEKFKNYTVEEDPNSSLKIGRKSVTINWSWAGTDGQPSIKYDGGEHTPSASFVGVEGTYSIPSYIIYVSRNGSATDSVVAVGNYTAEIVTSSFEGEFGNYTVVENPSSSLTIEILGITVVPSDNRKYYGQDDPTLAFTAVYTDGGGAITTQLLDELMAPGTPLKRVTTAATPCEDIAGEYDYTLVDSLESLYPNYSVSLQAGKFVIMPLPVTVTPGSGQRKYYGQAESVEYPYTVALTDPSIQLNPIFTNERIREELGNTLLARGAGQIPGTYPFEIGTPNNNYNITLMQDVYTIDPIKLKVSASSITSREGGFRVSTPDLDSDKVKLDSNIPRYIQIDASFPSDGSGIEFSKDLSRYIKSDSLLFGANSAEHTVKIEDYMYRTSRGGRTLSWPGKLPAGTKLTVSIADESGNVVSSNTATVEVTKVGVGLTWSSTARETPSQNYLNKGDKLVLTAANDASRTEYVEVRYNGTQFYESLDQTITPVASNNGSEHASQTAEATFLDSLNLAFADASFKFTYDDMAFPIPSENIKYENRGKKISITLPEEGTIKSVTIPGANVRIPDTKGKEFDLDVSFSGSNLIPTGTAVEVTYADQVGNEGKGSTVATRTRVNTPITIKIRPEMNAAGYLNGRSNLLVVSGSACSCEPLQVTCADMSQTTFASQKQVWSDDNGSWEITFDMARLPEGSDFRISAEYMDVDGTSASMTARYNAYVAMPIVTSPIFRTMPYIGGMTETGTNMLLYIGDKTYSMDVDEYGHFMMNNIDILMPGDQFTIQVNDIAGNTNILEFTVPQAGDPATTGGKVSAIGKYSFNGGKDSSSFSCATPVNLNSLSAGDLELPMLLGMAYKVGTYKVSRTENGFTVTSNLNPEVFKTPGSYKESNQRLRVYSSEPGSGSSGQEYQFGQEIPIRKGTVWIVPEEDLEVLISDISWLEVYNFSYLDDQERAAHPEKYQEYLNYVAYQRGTSAARGNNASQAAPLAAAPTVSDSGAEVPETVEPGVVEATSVQGASPAETAAPEEAVSSADPVLEENAA